MVKLFHCHLASNREHGQYSLKYRQQRSRSLLMHIIFVEQC